MVGAAPVALYLPLVMEEKQAGAAQGGKRMNEVKIYIYLAIVIMVVAFYACCRAASNCSREEEKEDEGL